MSYCPCCESLIRLDKSTDQMCEVCGWFGDWSELLSAPTGEFNVVKAVVTALDLYRDLCRKELFVEDHYVRGKVSLSDLRRSILLRQETTHSMIDMFVRLKNRKETP